MSAGRIIALFAVVFVASLLATAPAWLLRSAVTLPDNVVLAPLQGSLWRGQAEWLQVDGLRVEPLQWRLRPLGLLGGMPLQLSAEYPATLSARLRPGADGITLGASEASATLVQLLDFAELPKLGIDADLALVIDAADWSAGGCRELQGMLSAQNWHGDLDGLDAIGVLRGRLSCDANRLVIDVDPDNAIKLSGRLLLFTDGRYRVDMRMAPPPGELFDSLSQLLGRPRDGRQFILQAQS